MPVVEAALSAPTLSSPSNGATGVSTTPTFSWSSVLGATSYQIQVSTSSTFSPLVVDTEVPLVTSYIPLTPLSNDTTYYWRVRAKSLLETSGWSSTWSFTTMGLTISNVQVTNVTSTSATISWTTNRTSTGTVGYGTTKPPLLTSLPTSSGTTHSVALSLLLSNTTYYFKISAIDSANPLLTATADNGGNYYVFKTAAEAALTISNVQVTNVTSTSATISWTTNRTSTGAVYYGISKALAITPAQSLSTGTSHSVTLVVLPDTTYYFKITATDFANPLVTATADNNGNYYVFKTATIVQPISTSGAAFTIPETIRDDVSNFRLTIPQEIQSLLPIPIPTTGFLLANKENLSLVLAQQSDTGLASVEGWQISPRITLGGFELSAIVAKSVSFTKEGTPATVRGILANPQAYEFQLVKVDATRRQVSILYDPDDSSGIEFPVTAGYLVEDPVGVPELIKDAVRKGENLVSNLSDGLVQGIVIKETIRLPVFDFETDYWIDSPAVTNGIVLLPGSRILKLLENVSPKVGELIQLEVNLPVLYDVKTELESEPVPSVQAVKENPETYRGKVVELTVYGLQGTISVHEALRAVIPCLHGKENWIDIPTPEGPICVPVPLDVRLEGMVTWNTLSIPPKREEILIVFGASSHHQDKVFDNDLAEFKLVGKIVSTKLIDESLPEVIGLIIYKEEKIRDITIAELVLKRIIEENLFTLNWVLSNFSEKEIPEIPKRLPSPVIILPVQPIIVQVPENLPELIRIAEKVEVKVVVVRPETPIEVKLDNSRISEVVVKLKEVRENVKLVVQKLERKPPELPDPPGLVWAYHNIDVNVPADKIENGSITFWVLKEWLATHGVSKENIVMLRFHEGGWKELPTEILGENVTHVSYRASTGGFSLFAITAYEAEEKPVGIDPILIILGVVIGFIAVVVLIVLLRRRKRVEVVEKIGR